MNTSDTERLRRIDELVRLLRDAERELLTLTGEPDEGSPAESGEHFLLGEAQQRLQRAEAEQNNLVDQQLAILNALPAHIALLDAEGVIVSVNEAWERFATANTFHGCGFGVGVNYLAVCDDATGDCAAEAGAAAEGIRRVLAGEVPEFALEYPCHSPTERRWFRLMVTPLDDRQRGGAVVMHINITERRNAEDGLRESVARSTRAERIAHFGSWELSLLDLENLSNNPLTVSDELLRIAGVDRETKVPTAGDLAHLIPPEAKEEFREALRSAIERRPYSFTHRLIRPDGTERVIHELGRCFFDEATGRPIKVVGTAHDITERTRVDEALRASEREQRRLAEQLESERTRLAEAQRVAKVGSWENNLTTLDLLWSDETHRIFETDAATFRPTYAQFLDLVHPADRAAVDAEFTTSRRTHEPSSIEHRIPFADGRIKVVQERWLMAFDENGVPVRAFGTCHDITDQKRADEELLRSRDLFRIASRAARLGGWMIDVPTRKVRFSEELIAIHELPTNAEPTEEELMALYNPETRALLRGHMDACLRDGTPYDVELQKSTATGRQIWLRSIGEAVRDADGRIIRLQGAGQDITARKEAEQELARMNRALRLLSHCNDVLVRAQSEQELLDKACGIAADDGGYQLAWVGYAAEGAAKTITIPAGSSGTGGYFDGVGLSWASDVPEGQGPAGRTIRTGELVACRDVTVDATFAPWRERAVAHGIRSVLCFPLRDASSTFGVLGLYAADVSVAGPDELRLLQEMADNLAFGIVSLRARAAQQRSEQKLREQAALLDQTNEAIYVRDLDDCITYWNRGAERLYGWTSVEVVGRRAATLFHGTDATRLAHARTAFEQVLATGDWGGDITKNHKAGRALLIGARWSLSRDPHGQPRAVLTLDADVTEKRQLEAHLLRKQRLESIGTLAGGIAHDLNNVLTPILSSIAMLSEGETQPDRQQDFATLEASAQRGAAMVRQMMTFARGESQGLHKPVDVVALAGEVMKMMRETFPKDISPVLRIGESPEPIVGDATQIHQLITNLCLNACDAMPSGGVLTVALESVVVDQAYVEMSAGTPLGPYLRVRVEDTGHGMTPEIRDRIFEPFFTTKLAGTGSGLGLSTGHSIALNHGGFIVVSTEPGKGSRFDVYLRAPVATATRFAAATTQAQPTQAQPTQAQPTQAQPTQAQPTQAQPPQAQPTQAQLPQGRGELLLVVDDEEAIRKIARRMLERYGYRVLVAANGSEAVSVFTENAESIAAVITDMSMPVMDGPTAIAALKALDPSVRIVGSSGVSTDAKAVKARELGVIHWVPKPYTAEGLLRTIRAVLE